MNQTQKSIIMWDVWRPSFTGIDGIEVSALSDSIHHKTFNQRHLELEAEGGLERLELDWNYICSLNFLSFLWTVLLFSCTQPKHKTSETQRENRKCLPSFPLHCQTTKQWRQRDKLSDREDNSLYTKVTKVYFRTFTCQQTVSRQNVYIVCWRKAVIVWINDRCFIIN